MSSRDLARQLRRSAPLNEPRALCAALGLRARPNSRGALVCCPVHDDRSQSCSVFRAKDGTVAVKCHGCGFSADALGFVAAVRGLDLRRDWSRACDEAARLAHVVLVEHRSKPARQHDDSSDTCDEQSYHAVWTHALDLGSPLGTVSPAVADYLHSRGVFADAEAVDLRGLPEEPGPLLKALLATFERSTLEQAGLLWRGGSGLIHPAWRLVVPWRDRLGRITFVQRRRLDNSEPRYRSPRGRSPRAPFGVDLLSAALDALGAGAEVVIVEGALDTLARRQIARHRDERLAVIGVYSASSPCVGLPTDLLAGRRIVLALDADEAGDRACVALARELNGVAREFVRERPPKGAKDWNSTLVEVIT